MADCGDELTLLGGGALTSNELRELRRVVGWDDVEHSDDRVQGALDQTWNVTVRDGAGRLVALARVLDDGVFYATLWDMLVMPEYRRRGIATSMLALVLEHCRSRQIVSLVATPSGRKIYERAGFSLESRGSVGMLLRAGEAS